jgi:hypothetical protein
MPERKNPPKAPLSERLKSMMVEYGSLALYVYFSIFGLVLGGFVLAIKMGFHRSGHGMSTAGTWGAAYVATQLTKPLRLAATLVLTPVVMKVLHLKKRTPELPSTPES